MKQNLITKTHKLLMTAFILILLSVIFVEPCLAYTSAQPASLIYFLHNTQHLIPNTCFTTTKYIVDSNRSLPSALAETNSSGNITAYYVYGLGLISKIEGSNSYFYQYDGIGSTVAITDTAGNLKNKYAYADFGNLATNCTETISNPFKYVGKYGVMTDLPDLLYMRARYYMPSIGRFINEDPIGLAGGMNLYAYVGGNPIRLIDPRGLYELYSLTELTEQFKGCYLDFHREFEDEWHRYTHPRSLINDIYTEYWRQQFPNIIVSLGTSAISVAYPPLAIPLTALGVTFDILYNTNEAW